MTAVLLADAVLLAVLLVGGSSRAMLATARLSCLVIRADRQTDTLIQHFVKRERAKKST